MVSVFTFIATKSSVFKFIATTTVVLLLQPKPKYKQAACWDKLEKFNGEKFPQCVKMLLEKAAYDRLCSLKAIDAAKIVDIEAYLSEHRLSWINDLTCCQSEDYKKQASFQFLPGHKAIVLNIPEQIKQMNGVQKVAANKERTVTNKDRTDDELKDKLISNLMMFMEKNNFALAPGMISSKNIHDFERATDSCDFVCKCRFGCPFCARVFPVKFKQFWMSSNIVKHLKSHIEEEYVHEYVSTLDMTLDEENA